MTEMTREEYESQANKLFGQIGEIIENAPAMMVAEIALNLLETCMYALPNEGRMSIARGAAAMFKGVHEATNGSKKLDS